MGDVSGDIEIKCPECGHDVRTTRDLKRAWNHRSRLIPKLVWGLVVIILIVYCVKNGKAYWKTGADATVRSSRVHNEYSTGMVIPPNPRVFPTARPWVSLNDMYNAAHGDEQVLEKLEQSVEQLADWLLKNDHVKWIKLGLNDPYGYHSSQRCIEFGGLLWIFQIHLGTNDVRDPPAALSVYEWDREPVRTFYPKLSNSRESRWLSTIFWELDLILLFKFLCACMFITWGVHRFGRWVRVPFLIERDLHGHRVFLYWALCSLFLYLLYRKSVIGSVTPVIHSCLAQ